MSLMIIHFFTLTQNFRLWALRSNPYTHIKQQPTLVMNRLDPIEELYDMYSEEEDTPRIVELVDDGLDFDLDLEGPANPYMDL